MIAGVIASPDSALPRTGVVLCRLAASDDGVDYWAQLGSKGVHPNLDHTQSFIAHTVRSIHCHLRVPSRIIRPGKIHQITYCGEGQEDLVSTSPDGKHIYCVQLQKLFTVGGDMPAKQKK